MKLVIVMICDEDKERVQKVLNEHAYASTFIATTGNFMSFGKSLLLLGVEEEKIEDLKNVIDSCTRLNTINNGEIIKADLYIMDTNVYKK